MKEITIQRPKEYRGLGPHCIECLPSKEFVTELSAKLKENPDATELSIESDNINIPCYAMGDSDYLEFDDLPPECAQITTMRIKIENLKGDVLEWLLEAMQNLIALELKDTRIENSYDQYVGHRRLNISNLPALENLTLNNVKIPAEALGNLLSASHNTLKQIELNINKEDLESMVIDERLFSKQEYIEEKLDNGLGRLPSFPKLYSLSVNQDVLDVILKSTMEDSSKDQINDAANYPKIISDFTCVTLCFKHTTMPQKTKKIAENVPKDVIRKVFTYLYNENAVAYKKAFPYKEQDVAADSINKKMRHMGIS